MKQIYTHPKRKTKVVFVQLGSPSEPTTKALRKYLRKFLGDPRVVDINPWLWKIILNFFVLPFRPKKSAKLYARIWDGKSFPLITNTRDFTNNVREELKKIDPDGHVEVNHAFLLSPPYVNEVYDSWEDDLKKGIGATKLLVIPMFPQYSESTIASGIDALAKELSKRVKIPTFEVITNFHRTHAFIDNSTKLVDNRIEKLAHEGVRIDSLIISFHGMQKRRIVQKGDDDEEAEHGLLKNPYKINTQSLTAFMLQSIKELKLEKVGAEKGKLNQPASKSQIPDEIETQIQERIEAAKATANESAENQIYTYNERISNLDFEGHFSVVLRFFLE